MGLSGADSSRIPREPRPAAGMSWPAGLPGPAINRSSQAYLPNIADSEVLNKVSQYARRFGPAGLPGPAINRSSSRRVLEVHVGSSACETHQARCWASRAGYRRPLEVK
jgi:hypothetical protein